MNIINVSEEQSLKKIRIGMGMSQEGACELLGISIEMLNLYEKDSSDIGIDEAKRITMLYGKDIDDVYFGKTICG